MLVMKFEDFIDRYNKRELPKGKIELIGHTIVLFRSMGVLEDSRIGPKDEFDSSWVDPESKMSLEDCVRQRCKLVGIKCVRNYRREQHLDDNLKIAISIVKLNWDRWCAEMDDVNIVRKGEF